MSVFKLEGNHQLNVSRLKTIVISENPVFFILKVSAKLRQHAYIHEYAKSFQDTTGSDQKGSQEERKYNLPKIIFYNV
jgi:hypothetical protein